MSWRASAWRIARRAPNPSTMSAGPDRPEPHMQPCKSRPRPRPSLWPRRGGAPTLRKLFDLGFHFLCALIIELLLIGRELVQ
jgi:hypothetical protein